MLEHRRSVLFRDRRIFEYISWGRERSMKMYLGKFSDFLLHRKRKNFVIFVNEEKGRKFWKGVK